MGGGGGGGGGVGGNLTVLEQICARSIFDHQNFLKKQKRVNFSN